MQEPKKEYVTYYLVSQRSYSSMTGRPEAEPLLEVTITDGVVSAIFTEKWWFEAEKVPCNSISSLDDLRFAMARWPADADPWNSIFDSYRIERLDAEHPYKETPPRTTVSLEEFEQVCAALPRLSWFARQWRGLVWHNPDRWYDREGHCWKSNGNGSSPYRVQARQLGTRVIRRISRVTDLFSRVIQPFGYGVLFCSYWHTPTTSMTRYLESRIEEWARISRVGRLGLYRITTRPPFKG